MDRDTAKEANEVNRPAVLWINYDTLWFTATHQETMIGASANNPDNQQRRAPCQPHSNPASQATKTRWLPRDSQTGEKRRWIPPKEERPPTSSRHVVRTDDGYTPRAHSVVWYPESNPHQYADVYYYRVGVTHDLTNHQNRPSSEYVNRNRYDPSDYYRRGLVPVPDNQPWRYPPSRHEEQSRWEYTINKRDGLSNFDNRNIPSNKSHSAYRYTDLEHPGRMDGSSPHGHTDRQTHRAPNKEKKYVTKHHDCETVPGNINKSYDHGNDRRSSETESRNYRDRNKHHDLPSGPKPRPDVRRNVYPEDAVWNAESSDVTSDHLPYQKPGKSDYVRDGMVSNSSRKTQHERLSGANTRNNEPTRDIYPPKRQSGVSGKTSKDFSYPPINRSQKILNPNPLSEKDASSRTHESSDQYAQNIRSLFDMRVCEKPPRSKSESSHNEDTTDLRTSRTSDSNDCMTSSPHRASAWANKELIPDKSAAETKSLQVVDVSPEGNDSVSDLHFVRYSMKEERETETDDVLVNHPNYSKPSAVNHLTSTDSDDCKDTVDRHQNEHVQNIPETNLSKDEQFNDLNHLEEQAHPRTEPDSVPDVLTSVRSSDVQVSESTPTDKTCSSSTQIPNSDVDHTLACEDNQSHDQDGDVAVIHDIDTTSCNTEPIAQQRDPPGEDNPVSTDAQQQGEHGNNVGLRDGLNTAESDADVARRLFEAINFTPESDLDTTDSGQELEDTTDVENVRGRAIRGLTARELALLSSSKLQKIPITGKCEICWDPYKVGDAIRYLICAHYFHLACIDEWLKRTASCPVCRTVLADLFLPDVVLSHSSRRRRRRCIIL